MKSILILAFCLALPVTATPEDLEVSVIPEPVRLERLEGFFTLTPDTKILYEEGSDALKALGEDLAEYLSLSMGSRPPVTETVWEEGLKQSIVLLLADDRPDLGAEGYLLNVDRDAVVISAPQRAGVFYGTQTLRQLLPPDIERRDPSSGSRAFEVPCVRIEDRPRFAWRGFMMDTSRTFQTRPYLERCIDLMGLFKLNVLHLHLTDDQGWRLEIEKHPLLTAKGAKFAPKYSKTGGFYSKKEMKEILRYAAARNITIVPEIEMPGHCLAALAVYPQLSCTGGPFEIYPFFEGPGIQSNVFCPGNEKTFTFLEEVLTEVIELFPSTYIHLGGDEVPKSKWEACEKCRARIRDEKLKDTNELQSWFIKRLARFVEGKGRKVIGWDEIMEGGLAEGAAVMSWRGVKPGIEALKAGHDVVFTPTSHCYLDYTYERLPLDRSYAFEPVTDGMTDEETARILGVQGNMWTHIAETEDAVDAQVFPRLIALAEAAWSPKDRRDEKGFRARMSSLYHRLDRLGVQYYFPGDLVGHWNSAVVSETYAMVEWTITDLLDKPGPYEVTFRYDRGDHRLGIEWAALIEDGVEVNRDAHRGVTGARNENNVYRLRLKQKRKGSRYLLRASIRSEGGTDSFGTIWLKPQPLWLEKE